MQGIIQRFMKDRVHEPDTARGKPFLQLAPIQCLDVLGSQLLQLDVSESGKDMNIEELPVSR